MNVKFPRYDSREDFSSDESWGQFIVGYSAVELLVCSVVVLGGVSMLLKRNGAPAKTSHVAEGPEEFAAMIFSLAVVFFALSVILSAIRLFGGRKVMKGMRRGFFLVAIPSGTMALLTLPSLSTGFPLIVFLPNLAFLIYCVGRLRGRWGPAPV